MIPRSPSPTAEMIEAAARAICKLEGCDPDQLVDDLHYTRPGNHPAWWDYKDQARVCLRAASLPPPDAVRAAVEREREECARIAEWAHMVPPDGGSPTEGERIVAESAAATIRARSSSPAEQPSDYTKPAPGDNPDGADCSKGQSPAEQPESISPLFMDAPDFVEAEVERLTAKCDQAERRLIEMAALMDRAQPTLDAAQATIRDRDEQLKVLRAALEPFAFDDEWNGEPDSLLVEFCAYDGNRLNPSASVEDFRRARAALQSLQQPERGAIQGEGDGR